MFILIIFQINIKKLHLRKITKIIIIKTMNIKRISSIIISLKQYLSKIINVNFVNIKLFHATSYSFIFICEKNVENFRYIKQLFQLSRLLFR